MKAALVWIAVAATGWMPAEELELEEWSAWVESRPEAVWVFRNLEGTVINVQDFDNPRIEMPGSPLIWIRLRLSRDVGLDSMDPEIRDFYATNHGKQLAALRKLIFDADHGYPDTKRNLRPPGADEVLLLFPAELKEQVGVGDRLCVGAYELHPSSSPFGPEIPLQERGTQCNYRALFIDKTPIPNSK